MRINKFVAQATGMSRRDADTAIAAKRVTINNKDVQTGQQVGPNDVVKLDGAEITAQATQTIMLNKPAGYVVSRDGQGSKTIYNLLPEAWHNLKPVGRLDKDSSGLLIVTNDGELANTLTHPSYGKTKIYDIVLDKPLADKDLQAIQAGVNLDDGPSHLNIKPLGSDPTKWQISMSEGRNRQIRRTFKALGYTVTYLHRTNFGPYSLGDLKPGNSRDITSEIIS